MGIVAIFVFLLLHLSPGDPAAIIAGDNASGEQIAGIRKQLGLDDPLPIQFFRWLAAVLHGDLGISIFSNEPVLKLISQRVEPTLSLALTTLVVAVTLAVSFGVLAAWKVGTWIDRALMVVSVIGFSVPVFVVGYMLIYVFSINLRWLPVQGYSPIDQGLWPWFERLILPSIALGLAYVALIARITRTAMLDVLAEDYIRTAKAKGVATKSMLLKHALKNAGVPIITVIGIGVALLIGGVVITETVFNIPGVGRLVVDAISKRDYPIIQGVILIFSGVYVLVNLLVDMSYTLLDPRIRY
jgi:peptide/nickel transport system permease protein